jgi:hypothetical protein
MPGMADDRGERAGRMRGLAEGGELDVWLAQQGAGILLLDEGDPVPAHDEAFGQCFQRPEMAGERWCDDGEVAHP